MTLPHVWVSLIFLVVCVIGKPIASGQPGAVLSEAQIDQGKKIFVKYCMACHGVEGKGDGYTLLGADPANLTSPATKKKSDTALLKLIHEGKSSMPSWNVRLSEQDSRNVLAYIRTLSQ